MSFTSSLAMTSLKGLVMTARLNASTSNLTSSGVLKSWSWALCFSTAVTSSPFAKTMPPRLSFVWMRSGGA